MKRMKRFKQAYLDICFSQEMYLRRVNKILRVLNHGGFTCRY